MRRIDITVTEQILAKLKEQKEATGLSMSDLIRRALERYFEVEQPDTRILSQRPVVGDYRPIVGQSSEDSD